MLDIEDYRKLSLEARKFYDEHRDYFDKIDYFDSTTLQRQNGNYTQKSGKYLSL